MITLYESILSSTKTGKENIIERVKEWATKNLRGSFECDLKISGTKDGYIYINELVREIPDYINFDYVYEFNINHHINDITEKQFPNEISILHFWGDCAEIDCPFTLKVDKRISCCGYQHLLKTIKHFDIEFKKSNDKMNGVLDLDGTSLKLDEIQKITAKNINILKIKDTPSARTIIRNCKKFPKVDKAGLTKYLDDIFKNFEGLDIVELNSRTMLRKAGNSWYII